MTCSVFCRVVYFDGCFDGFFCFRSFYIIIIITSVYTCAVGEAQKKVVGRLNMIFENCDKGSICANFQEKGSFLNSIIGMFGGHFSNSSIPPNTFLRKSCSGGKIGCKNQLKFLFGVFFPGKGKSLLGCFVKLLFS